MNSVKNSPILEFEKNNDVGLKIAKVIAFVLVLVGMLNTIPAIPGLEQLIWDITGNNKIVFRKFSYEYFFPIIFFMMIEFNTIYLLNKIRFKICSVGK